MSLREEVPFTVAFILLPFMESNPKTGAWISVFKPNAQNLHTFYIIETTAAISTNFFHNYKDQQVLFVALVGGPNTRPLNEFKMADGSHFDNG